MKKKIKGFSLVELMVTLIIVSILTAALAPVITKKLKSSSVTVGSFNSNISNIEMDCSLFGEKCSLCDSVKCISCSEICEYDQALNIQECSCKNCSDLFGSDCKQCSINACSLCEKGNYISGGKCAACEAGYKCDGITRTQCQDGYYALSGASECEKCANNCTNCEKDTGKCLACISGYKPNSTATKCVACAAGYMCDGITRTQCQDGYYALGGASECEKCANNCTNCEKDTGKCLACETGYEVVDNACIKTCGDLSMKLTLNGKAVCMMKYNAGDKTEFSLPSSITLVNADAATCTPSSTKYCCWIGTTSANCDSVNGGYSGCTRTVCDYRAANEFCSKLIYLGKSWRLPTSNELSIIATMMNNISIGQGSNGLMLCGHYGGYSSTHCESYQKCNGATGNWCDARYIRSSTPTYSCHLDTNALVCANVYHYEQAQTVRCVADL